VVFRLLSGVMAALFAVAVAVQYNDPDPIRWSLLYGAACAVSIAAIRSTKSPRIAALAVGAVALVWGGYWAVTSSAGLALYQRMFDSWEMKSTPIEEAREASGLLIVAGWMAVIAIRSFRAAPPGAARR
jgi:tetrahydromethanopterin S-methyltransferase subunit E